MVIVTVHNESALLYNNQTLTVHRKIVSDDVFYMFKVVVYVTLIGLVSTFGIVANIINILVFVKQGLMSDSSNVSLCGLAVADLLCSFFLLWMSALWVMIVSEPPGLDWDPHSVMYLTSGHPYILFNNVTCAISAYISIERCLCVVFPFRVKTLFSAKRSLIIVLCINFYFVLCLLPIFLTLRLGWMRNPLTNSSKLVLQTMKYYEEVDLITSYNNSVIPKTVTTLIVLVCTQITVHRVKSSLSWRKSVTKSKDTRNTLVTSAEPTRHVQNPSITSTENAISINGECRDADVRKQPKNQIEKKELETKISSKESTLVRMITMISVIFVIFNTPDVIINYAISIEPDIRNFGPYHNLFFVLFGVKFVMESINCSVNIFVYYNMGTKYRNVFRMLLGVDKDEKNENVT